MYVEKLCDGYKITIFVVKNVNDTKTLRTKVLSGDLDCCVVKACLVPDPLLINIAARKAVINRAAGRLITKSLNLEVLYNLSISKNITQSLLRFGLDEEDRDIVVCVIEEEGGNRAVEVALEIEGDHCSIEELPALVNKQLLAKTYKITETELGVSTLLNSVVSRIATKDFGSH